MRQVTLGDEDVEWIDPMEDEHAEVKTILHDDAGFDAWADDRGILDALWIVYRFHRTVANQLISRGVSDPGESDWARRAIRLTKELKWRRAMLRHRFIEVYGEGSLREFLDTFKAQHPRAVRPVAVAA